MNNELRRFGRSKNALLHYFENYLHVPMIYLDANWDGQSVDVLAMDRGGGGDVHAVLIYKAPLPSYEPLSLYKQEDAIDAADVTLGPGLDALQTIPAQYKYLAAVNVDTLTYDPLRGITPALVERSYDPCGLGRVGFFSIDPAGEDEPRVKLVQKPERFRAKVSKLVDEYIEQHVADWEIRP